METTNINNLNNCISSNNFHPLTFSSGETSFHTTTAAVVVKSPQNPRKKRTTKFLKTDTTPSAAAATKPKPARKPDPTAPKITKPCTECGKKFWSWKALFGHMRCHPERQWRGINPPANLRRLSEEESSAVTAEDHEVATCLLMLANGPSPSDQSPSLTTVNQGMPECSDPEHHTTGFRFECSSCKKVFGSHQALGGHRASHKNVKGCYAITKNDEGEELEEGFCTREADDDDHVEMEEINEKSMTLMGFSGHKCSICSRVFSSGQALGGHKRCHWEKTAEDPLSPVRASGGLDLNIPADADEDCSELCLDLRLGL